MERTAAEAKADYERAMGPGLGAIYSALWQELAWLHRKWDAYVALFGTKPERVGLLNEAAPAFFGLVQDSLWEDVLIHVARLTDPAKSSSKTNLSLQALVEAVDRPGTKTAASDGVKACLVSAAFARDWRNRRIAHKDFDLALDQGAHPLSPASREMVSKALADLVAVVDVVSHEYLRTTNLFLSAPDMGGSINLLHVLRDGLTVKAERQARLESGQWNPQDMAAWAVDT